MPINIDNSSFPGNEYNKVSYNRSGSAESIRSSSHASISSAGRDLMSPGSTITGEIVGKDGNEVTIKLSDNQTISAKLQGNADIEVGMKMTFEVAKGADNQMSLRPLYSNLANNSAAVSALRAANLPVNDTTVSMTDKMMSESMPVNRAALTEMFRNVSAHSNVSPESIVQMTKLNMPLTDSNVIQFDNYRNFEHQITNDLQNTAQSVADLFEEAMGHATDSQSVADFGGMSPQEVISEVLNLIDTDSLETIAPDTAAVTSQPEAVSESVVNEEIPAQASAMDQAVVPEAAPPVHEAGTLKNTVDGIISGLKGMFSPDTQLAEENDIPINTNLSLDAQEQQLLTSQLSDILILAEESSDIYEPLDPSQVMAQIKQLVSEYPPEDVKVIEAEISGYSEETYESVDEENLNLAAEKDIAGMKNADNAANAANAANASGNTNALSPENTGNTEITGESVRLKIAEKLNELLKSDGFSKLVKDSIKAQMSIKPEEVASNGKIDELYDRIQKTSARITQLMESIGRSDSPAAQSANALSDNVNFMNQLNEFVNYVQLPLKMAGEDANGELYVYTNKKNLANSDGNFSALLHLDMEHLGPMDVYVSMRDYTRVNTNFYLQTEELLDFIESHIDELTKRLTDKGYNTTMKVSQKQPGVPITPITDEFTKDEMHEDAKMIVSKMRFDVRA